MTILIVIIGLLVFFLAIMGLPLAVFYVRGLRDKKNYERSLKLVPLLIHLPPMSEDIISNGRDVRDLVDENISKAQIIYNIIASTYQKGYKNKLFGQRSMSFEVIGSQGLVYFYVIVPVGLVDVVKQAIISAYSTAQIEEAAEHNIFNSVGKITGVLGGEFELKKSYSYPIATYQDLKTDTMQTILNALSTLDKEDGAAIQIIIRPADPKWRQKSSATASNVRKGQSNKGGLSGLGGLARQALEAYYKPPEFDNANKNEDKPSLSSLDQAVLDSVDDKTRYQGYETLIRLVVSSNVSQRTQAILANLTASFSLFDAPGKNGFKYVPAESIERLVSDYLLRLFPQHKNKMILNAVELATLFHFPDQRSIPTSQLKRQESKQVDGPRDIPADGLMLGYNLFRGAKKAIRIALTDRQRHIYVVGQTGTGKSTFLENLALQDMLNGNGFAFVDPHGDSVDRLLAMVPKERTEDIIYFSPAETDYPMGLNIFEFETAQQKDLLIQEALNMLYKLYDPNHQGIMGPRYEHLFRNAALTVMADPAGGTFIDIPKLFRDPKYVQQKLQYVKDHSVREFWEKEMPQSQRSNEFGDVVSWFISKFGAFLSNETMRNIIGQNKSAFDLRDIMDKKKILLVNLSKGRIGELNSKLLGMVIIMKFQAAAMSRARVLESERNDFSLFVDEFQNFSTESFATIMSEARKYHLNLIVANQFTTQLTEEIQDAVFGNVGTTVAFRVGDRDAEVLSKYFRPTFEPTDLIRLPNYNTVVRTMIDGVPTQAFSMATLPPLGNPNARLAYALKQLTAAKYGRPKMVVEKEIFARMEIKAELTKPGFDIGSFNAHNPATPTPAWTSAAALTASDPFSHKVDSTQLSSASSALASKPKAESSFLDEWLTKRGQAKPSPNDQMKHLEKKLSADPSLSSQLKQTNQQSTKNISSNALEEQEIDQLAAQLRQDVATKTIQPVHLPQDKNKSVVGSAKIDNSQTLQSKTPINEQPAQPLSSAKINQVPTKNEAEDNTISIDQEGEIHINQD